MDFIVVEKIGTIFLALYVINVDNLLELRHFIKENFDIKHDFNIYDIDGVFIEYF